MLTKKIPINGNSYIQKINIFIQQYKKIKNINEQYFSYYAFGDKTF